MILHQARTAGARAALDIRVVCTLISSDFRQFCSEQLASPLQAILIRRITPHD
jgi:hypothetical protein